MRLTGGEWIHFLILYWYLAIKGLNLGDLVLDQKIAIFSRYSTIFLFLEAKETNYMDILGIFLGNFLKRMVLLIWQSQRENFVPDVGGQTYGATCTRVRLVREVLRCEILIYRWDWLSARKVVGQSSVTTTWSYFQSTSSPAGQRCNQFYPCSFASTFFRFNFSHWRIESFKHIWHSK